MGGLSSTTSEEDSHASAAAVRSEFRQQLQSRAENCGGDCEGVAASTLYSRRNPHIHLAMSMLAYIGRFLGSRCHKNKFNAH